MGYVMPYTGDIIFVRQEGLKNYTRHYLFSTWRGMNIRCYDDRHKSFHRYGGRGITVCPEWRWDNCLCFVNFIKDVGERPTDYTLDRIDNESNYCKDNCKWSTKKEQQNNLGKSICNKSGNVGVSYNKRNKCWLVQIQLNFTTHLIGVFDEDNKELAVQRYEDVKKVKLEKGDEFAIDYYNSLEQLTPSGRRLTRSKKSKYFGVSPKRGKWRAYNTEYVDGKRKQVNLGVYDDEETAYAAVLKRLEEIQEEI